MANRDRTPPAQETAAAVWALLHSSHFKDYTRADMVAADALRDVYPGITDYANNSRSWLLRAVAHAAQTLGVRQFLDVGAGLPVEHNTHQVAHAHQPDARTVYIDIDPRVQLYQDALAGLDRDRVYAAVADMRDTDTVLTHARDHLDFSRPICVIFSDCLGHLHELDEALGAVHRLCAAMPANSYLALSHSTRSSPSPYPSIRYTARPPHVIERFFEGLDILQPGLVSVQDWHPDHNTPRNPDLHDATYAAIARMP